MRPLTNYKFLDDIMMELAGKLKIQQQQDLLAEMWKPYMKNLDTMYTDATCYESEMRYPTDSKLLWEGIEKSYLIMCEFSSRLKLHRYCLKMHKRLFGVDAKKVGGDTGYAGTENRDFARVRATAMEGRSVHRKSIIT